MQRAKVHRVLVRSGLAVLLGIASLTLVRCTQVGDHLTGVRLTADNPASCIKGCNETALAQSRAEQETHHRAIEACQSLPEGPQRDECLAAEEQRHEAAMELVAADRVTCHNGCYHEGAGGAE